MWEETKLTRESFQNVEGVKLCRYFESDYNRQREYLTRLEATRMTLWSKENLASIHFIFTMIFKTQLWVRNAYTRVYIFP